MKQITLNIEKVGQEVRVNVHYPELDLNDPEAMFCLLLKPHLYSFLEELPIKDLQMIGYGFGDNPEEANRKAALMSDIVMSGIEKDYDETTNNRTK